MTQQKKSYLLPIAMMFALFAMISFVTGLPAPFGVIVQNQFGATNFQATLGFAANFIAYFFMGIPSGMLLQKIGYKKTALIAILVGFTGVGVQALASQAGPDYGFLSLRSAKGGTKFRPPRSIYFRFLHVYVERCSKPNVEYTWWWRQKR